MHKEVENKRLQDLGVMWSEQGWNRTFELVLIKSQGCQKEKKVVSKGKVPLS